MLGVECCFFLAGIASAAGIVEGEKSLPLVQDVDVVVIGGSSGAVAAALKAAEAGAKVFVAAPRPISVRIWRVSSGCGSPVTMFTRCGLITKMFMPEKRRPESLPFTYKADKVSAAAHKDIDGKMLADGKWTDAPIQCAV